MEWIMSSAFDFGLFNVICGLVAVFGTVIYLYVREKRSSNH